MIRLKAHTGRTDTRLVCDSISFGLGSEVRGASGIPYAERAAT